MKPRENRKPETTQEAHEQFVEAWLDLVYVITKALGLHRLEAKLGMKPKPWVRERQIRDEWDA